MASVRHLGFVMTSSLNLRKLQYWSRDLNRHVILHLCSKFRVDRPIWRRDVGKKRFSIWRPSAMLYFQNFEFFGKCPSWELKCTSTCRTWSKSDNSRLKYGDNAIFKMVAVRHLEFAKIAVLDTWLISAFDLHLCSKFRVDRLIWRRHIAKKRFSIWRPSAILDLLWCYHIPSENCISRSQLCVKFSH